MRLWQEAQALQDHIEANMGKEAKSDVNFETVSKVIVAKGEKIGNDHITAVQEEVNHYLGNLQI